MGVRTSRERILYSRNHKIFNQRFPQIAEALGELPADSVIDGEVVALDESGRPDSHRLQHFAAEASRIRYFVFSAFCCAYLFLGGPFIPFTSRIVLAFRVSIATSAAGKPLAEIGPVAQAIA